MKKIVTGMAVFFLIYCAALVAFAHAQTPRHHHRTGRQRAEVHCSIQWDAGRYIRTDINGNPCLII